MTKQIFIQIDNELREATPEEAAEILATQAETVEIYGTDETPSDSLNTSAQ
jgi:hypothetical protein